MRKWDLGETRRVGEHGMCGLVLGCGSALHHKPHAWWYSDRCSSTSWVGGERVKMGTLEGGRESDMKVARDADTHTCRRHVGTSGRTAQCF